MSEIQLDPTLIPADLWQVICLPVGPRSLCACLCTSKKLRNALLTEDFYNQYIAFHRFQRLPQTLPLSKRFSLLSSLGLPPANGESKQFQIHREPSEPEAYFPIRASGKWICFTSRRMRKLPGSTRREGTLYIWNCEVKSCCTVEAPAHIMEIRIFQDIAVLRGLCFRADHHALLVSLSAPETRSEKALDSNQQKLYELWKIPRVDRLIEEPIRAMSDFTTEGLIALLLQRKAECQIVNVLTKAVQSIEIQPLPKTLDYHRQDDVEYVRLDLHPSRLWVSYRRKEFISMEGKRAEYCVKTATFTSEARIPPISYLFEKRYLASIRHCRNSVSIGIEDLLTSNTESQSIWQSTFSISSHLGTAVEAVLGAGILMIHNGYLITNHEDRCRFWDLRQPPQPCNVPLQVPPVATPFEITCRGTLYARATTTHLQVNSRDTGTQTVEPLPGPADSWAGSHTHFYGASLFLVSPRAGIAELTSAPPLTSWRAWPKPRKLMTPQAVPPSPELNPMHNVALEPNPMPHINREPPPPKTSGGCITF